MASIRTDQAEGLRRMLAKPAPRVLTFLSAKPGPEKNAMLVNLAASLERTGSSVLLLDACPIKGVGSGLDRARRGTLLQVANGERRFDEVALVMPQGFSMAVMARKQLDTMETSHMDVLFRQLAMTNDLVMVDADLGPNGLPLRDMAGGDIVIMVEDDTQAITGTYSLIKRLSDHYGRRNLSILVTGTDAKRAGMIFKSISNAARRYLAIELQSIGSVPEDAHLERATKLGRAVIDAFPLAGASAAFRDLAGHFAHCGAHKTDRQQSMPTA